MKSQPGFVASVICVLLSRPIRALMKVDGFASDVAYATSVYARPRAAARTRHEDLSPTPSSVPTGEVTLALGDLERYPGVSHDLWYY